MMFLLLGAAWAGGPSIPDGECRCWVGQTRGNDVVKADVRLCRQGRSLSGGFDWTGEASGRSFRVLEGELVGSRAVLHDAARTFERPAQGWRFCSVEDYSLTFLSDGGLQGTYTSKACNDRATVSLTPSTCASDAGPDLVRGPRPELVPDEVQACRDRGLMWLSDPDYYERTEIEADGAWTPVWQVRDRQGGRLGHLLVYPRSCRVVVGVLTPLEGAEPTFEIVPPAGSEATPAEVAMLRRWAGLR